MIETIKIHMINTRAMYLKEKDKGEKYQIHKRMQDDQIQNTCLR